MSTILAASTACQEARLGTTSGKGYYSPNVRVDGLGTTCCPLELLPGAASTGMLEFLSLRTRLCTAARNYSWSEQNKTKKPSDEPPTGQEHRPGVRSDQARRARLIARSITSLGCLSLVKSVFGFVVCSFESLRFKVVYYLCTRATALCCLYCTGLCRKYYLHKATFVCKCTSTVRFLFRLSFLPQ